MSTATARLETIAKIDTWVAPSDKVTIAKVAAALAPALIPMMSGLASGLRNMV